MKQLTLLLSLVAVGAMASTWTFDDTHSTARFKVRHLMISNVSGEITGFEGKATIDDKAGLTGIDVNVAAKTINTQNVKRDEHLKNPDFFDAAKFPMISFKSTKITKTGMTYTVVGDLSLHGVTESVTFTDADLTAAIKDPWGNNRRGFSAHTKISRKKFGMTWNKAIEAGGVAVGDEVDVQVECELVAAKEPSKG